MPKGVYTRKVKIKRVCHKCKKEHPGRGLKYCSHKCAASGENNSFYGKKHTEEAKKKMSRIGMKHTDATKKKMSMDRKGEKSHFWKGGISTYERKLYLNTMRRAIKLGAEGSHTQGEWEHIKALYNWTCPACWKKEPEIKLTEDHIVPLTKKGSNNIENIQPLCRSCNSRKHDKIIRYNA